MQIRNLTEATDFFLVGFDSSQLSNNLYFCLLLVDYCGTLFGNLLIITLVSTNKILHTPMYFFISQLSINDIMLTTDIVPNALHILLNNGGTITFVACITQFCFYVVAGGFGCVLLTVMSYDRYVAICNPLRYTVIMTSAQCVKLTFVSLFSGFLVTLIEVSTVLMLTYCGPNIIEHFYCDVVPLIEISCSDTYIIELEVNVLGCLLLIIPLTIIIISYINIIITILRFQSSISRQKAFSTCSSHLLVVCIFYITPLIVYIFPTGGQNMNIRKILSLLYTVVIPFINPIIYSLRNKDINKSIRDKMNKYVTCKYGRNLWTKQ